jgi:micrococcal nuclease
MKQLLTIIFALIILTCFGTTTKVTRIIDGDTFETETGEKVRLIGINTPEISDIFGQEAKQHLANLIDQKTIDLQTDNISNDRDRYSRLLRYVILNGTDINKQMLSDGFATAYLKYHFSKSEEYRQAQITATTNHFGMWGNKNKDEITEKQKDKVGATHPLSSKVYFIGGVILLLICFGIYFSLKK